MDELISPSYEQEELGLLFCDRNPTGNKASHVFGYLAHYAMVLLGYQVLKLAMN